jgi:hypothetical protein
MELGQILDIITTWNNVAVSNDNDGKTSVRNATQADYDRF